MNTTKTQAGACHPQPRLAWPPLPGSFHKMGCLMWWELVTQGLLCSSPQPQYLRVCYFESKSCTNAANGLNIH